MERRYGFTLIELLVVIAIVAVMIGLTLSAVQRVRAASGQTRCQNNFRQLGLAAQNHHAAHAAFPIGVTSGSDPREPYPFMTWMVRLQPYLEQDAIWRESQQAFRTQSSFQFDPPHAHRERAMPLLSCPLDPRTQSPAAFPSARSGEIRYGLTSYLGVMGISPNRLGGLLHLDSACKFADIADGSSNTLLIGERPPSSDVKFGWWYAGEGMRKDGSADSVLGVRTYCLKPTDCDQCGDDPAPFKPGAFDQKCDMLHFWSPHAGGANFAFADGSVRFLRYSADPIMPALATRAGGEVVEMP